MKAMRTDCNSGDSESDDGADKVDGDDGLATVPPAEWLAVHCRYCWLSSRVLEGEKEVAFEQQESW